MKNRHYDEEENEFWNSAFFWIIVSVRNEVAEPPNLSIIH